MARKNELKELAGHCEAQVKDARLKGQTDRAEHFESELEKTNKEIENAIKKIEGKVVEQVKLDTGIAKSEEKLHSFVIEQIFGTMRDLEREKVMLDARYTAITNEEEKKESKERRDDVVVAYDDRDKAAKSIFGPHYKDIKDALMTDKALPPEDVYKDMKTDPALALAVLDKKREWVTEDIKDFNTLKTDLDNDRKEHSRIMTEVPKPAEVLEYLKPPVLKVEEKALSDAEKSLLFLDTKIKVAEEIVKVGEEKIPVLKEYIGRYKDSIVEERLKLYIENEKEIEAIWKERRPSLVEG